MATPIGDAFVRIRPDTSGFQSSLSSTLKKAVGVGAGLAGVGLGAKLFTDAINSAKDFEQTLNVFGATANATKKQLANVRAESIRLGKDTKLPTTSAKDAATAMLELAKGGLSVTASMKAARGVLQLSAAAQISNADAAMLTANALQAFGLQAKESSRVADLLAASANATSSSIPDMGAALQQVAAVAHAANVPIEDTVAALGELANAGIKGSDAGTSLKTMLLALNPHTNKAANLIDKLGVSAFDAAGKQKNMATIIGQYKEALTGMSDQQRQSTLQTIFGTDAVRAANIILGSGAAKFGKMKKAVTEAGAAQKLAEAQTKGFAGALSAFQSNLETFQVELGTALLPTLTKVVGALSNMVSVFSRIQGAKGFQAKIDVVMGSTEVFFNQIKEFLLGTDTQQRIPDARVMVTVHKEGLLDKLSAAIGSINWTPIGLKIGTAIGNGLKISAGSLQKMIDTIVEKINENAGKIASAGALIFANFVKTLLDPVFWAKNWAIGLAIALSVIPVGRLLSIGGKLVAFILKPLGELGAKMLPFMTRALVTLGGDAGAGAVRIGAKIIGALTSAAAKIPGVLVTAGARMVKAMDEAAGNVVTTISNALGKLPSLVRGLLKIGVIDQIVEAAADAVQAAYDLGVGLIQGVVDGIQSAPGAIAGALGDAVGGGVSAVAGKFGVHSPSTVTRDKLGRPLAAGVVEGFVLGMRDLPTNIFDSTGRVLEAMKAKIDAQRSSLSAAFSRVAGDALTAFDARTAQLLAANVAKFDKWRVAATKVFEKTKDALKTSFDTAFAGIEKGLQDTLTGIDKALSSQLSGIEAGGAAETPAEAQLRKLRAERAAASRAGDISSAQSGLAAATAGGDAAAIAAAQKTLDDAKWAQLEFDLEQQASSERVIQEANAKLLADQAQTDADAKKLAAQTAADEAKIALQTKYDAELALIQSAYDNQNAAWDAQQAKEQLNKQAMRDLSRRHLEDWLADQQAKLEESHGNWQAMSKKIIKHLREKFAPDLKSAAINLGKSFDEGFEEGAKNIKTLAESIAKRIADYLKTQSPAKKGPLSTLDTWWEPFGKTLLGGFDAQALTRDLDSKLRGANIGAGISLNPASRAAGDVSIDDAAILAQLQAIVDAVKARPTVGSVVVNADDPNQLLNQLALLARP